MSSLMVRETNAQYHANPAASSSKLRQLNERGAYFYKAKFIDRTIPADEQTPALRFGCAFDTLMTDGMKAFQSEYVIRPEGMDFRTKKGSDWKLFNVRDETKLLTHDEWLCMESMRKAINSHPLSPVLFPDPGIAQITVRMPMSEYGTAIQCRPDWLFMTPCTLSNGLPYSINLKTTLDWSLWFDNSDPDSDRQGKPIYDHGYHRQAALDQHVMINDPTIGETAHFLLVVEKQEPFRVGVVQLTEEYLEAGWYETKADLLELKKCFETGNWPNGRSHVVQIRPPSWLLKRANRKESINAAT